MTLVTDIGWHRMKSPPPGGLVIRSFQDVAKAMRMRMAWKLVTETSLWSTFFRNTCKTFILGTRLGCSKLWTEIASVMREILFH